MTDSLNTEVGVPNEPDSIEQFLQQLATGEGMDDPRSTDDPIFDGAVEAELGLTDKEGDADSDFLTNGDV